VRTERTRRAWPAGSLDGVRSWAVWSLNRPARCFLLGTELLAAIVLVWALLAEPVTSRALIRLGVLVGLSGVYSAASARVERLGRLLHHDKVLWANQKSVWVAAALLVAPPGWVGLLVVVLFGQTLLHSIRDKALRPHRTLYTMAASVLGALAAGEVYAVFGAESLASPGKALAVITTLGVFTATSLGLVIAGAYLAGRPPHLRVLLPSPAALADEGAALTVGAAAGLVVLLAPSLAPMVLILVAVLHRSALTRHLQAVATTDAKTGLLTSLAWHQRAEQLLQDTSAAGSSAVVLMIDLDHFKTINDTYGHLVGDEVLTAVAQQLTQRLRAGDLLGRFGGEEFIVLLPDTNAAAGHEVAERMRRGLHTIHLEHAPTLCVRASVGAAAYPEHGATLTDVIRTADHTLYTAKDAGRDTTLTAHQSSTDHGGW